MSDATSGMTSDYDDASEYQRDVARSGDDLVRASVEAIGSDADPFTILDIGSGTGGNAVAAVKVALEASRSLDPDRRVIVLHNDLPTNDWNHLFADVCGSQGYASADENTLALASSRSFFEWAAPPSSVHLTLSANSAHWLRSQLRVHAPGALYFDATTGSVRAELAEQAARDWTDFLRSRAVELRPGGHLLVQCLASVEDDTAPDNERASAGRLLGLMEEVAESLVADGILAGPALDDYVLPVYARSVAEARAPLEPGSELDGAFDILTIGTAPIPSPYEAQLAASNDANAYAAEYAAFVRGWSESSLHDALFTPGTDDPDGATEEFYRRLRERFASEPGEHPFDDWTLTVWLRRTSVRIS